MHSFAKSALAKFGNYLSLVGRRLSQREEQEISPTQSHPRTRNKKTASPAKQAGPPPVAPKPKRLPFYAPEFSWETFEGFFCDFLAAGPELIGSGGNPQRIVSTSLYGRRGDNQHGIDIRAEMANGEVWVFQCKHYKNWGPKDTKDAIAKCGYTAARKFLLVTRAISPETREVVAKEKSWLVWDSEDISREFFARLSPETAARLLYTSFGPAWPKELLGLPGLGPFYSAEAKFAPLLEDGRSFHHRLALIGRKEWLQALNNFIEDERNRVFLLCGRGGMGKSRILREWSRDFSNTHKGWTLRFVSDSPSGFGPALDACSLPLVLIFDDAHRLDEVRRALFTELPCRKEVKLVLSLRAGPVAQVEAELVEAGFDVTQIQRPDEVKPLSSALALELAEAALGEELAFRFRLRLRDLSRDCPLLAVLAAELLKRGDLVERDLNHTDEFRIHVFNGLLQQAKPVEERFGATRTKDLLRLLAVLSPVQNHVEFLKKAADFLGGDVQPSHVTEMLEALDNVGLLLKSGAGIRVTPDLLSDHLSFTACYDKNGHDTTFTERVFTYFSPAEFPRLIQHLAEAEWRALKESDSAQSVVEPLWQWFLYRFRESSFHARHDQLKQWANIAHLQARRTLELAQLSLQLEDAPPAENTWHWGEERDCHTYVISAVPALLKPLARSNPESVGCCLDILWQIGRSLPPPQLNSQTHPIATIGAIASYEGSLFPRVQREVLRWLQSRLSGDDWISSANDPVWLLKQLLNPFFSTSIEECWSTGRTFHLRSHLVHLGNTAEFRNGVLGLCRSILERRSIQLALAVLEVLVYAIRRAHIPNCNVAPEFEDEWLVERRKALAVLAEIKTLYASPIVHYRIHEVLINVLKYDSTNLCEDCKTVLESIPNTLELRVLRTILGGYWQEFCGFSQVCSNDGRNEARREWECFVHSTVDSMMEAWPDCKIFLARLEIFHTDLSSVSFNPNFEVVFDSISDRHPGFALDLVNHLIENPSHPLGWGLGALTAKTPEHRLALCREAIATGADGLKEGAIDCFAWWRREGDLPEIAWLLLGSIAEVASPRVAVAIIRFVRQNSHCGVQADWHLLASLPADVEKLPVILDLLGCSAELLRRSLIPSPDIADRILIKLDNLQSLDGGCFSQSLTQFAIHFPGKTFMLMWRRLQLQETATARFQPIPYDFDLVGFDDVFADQAAASVIAELERRLIDDDEMDYGKRQLLRIAVMQNRGGLEPHLLRLLDKASSPLQLSRLASFAEERVSWPIVLECVDFTRRILSKARTLSADCYKEIFRRLGSLPGIRGFSSMEPDEGWKALVEATEKMAERHAMDPELGPFYAYVLKRERDWISDMKKRERADDSAFGEYGE
jgi:hypothetical protein